jgi:hypothetical protein
VRVTLSVAVAPAQMVCVPLSMAVGACELETSMVSVAWHPVLLLVIRTQYFPAAETCMFCVVTPVLQR